MSIQSKFNTFNQRIQLTRQDDAYKDAREKDDSITGAIKTKFKEKGYPVIDDFVQGSLITFTAIKEKYKDFDIDRASGLSISRFTYRHPYLQKNLLGKLSIGGGEKRFKC